MTVEKWKPEIIGWPIAIIPAWCDGHEKSRIFPSEPFICHMLTMLLGKARVFKTWLRELLKGCYLAACSVCLWAPGLGLGGGRYLWEGEAAACPLVVLVGALKLQVLPLDPPQHPSQLLLQLQLPSGGHKPHGQREESREDLIQLSTANNHIKNQTQIRLFYIWYLIFASKIKIQ